MKSLKSVLAIAGVTTAAVFAFASPAMAGGDDDNIYQGSDDSYGFLTGNNIAVPITNQFNVLCGVGLGVFGYGEGNAGCSNKS